MIITSAGEGKLNTVERNDLAIATANVLAEEGHENKTYELASSETWNYDELANILSDVSGKTVSHQSFSDSNALEKLIESGVPEGIAQFQITLYNSIANGNEGNTSHDLEELIGRKPTSIRESITHLFNRPI